MRFSVQRESLMKPLLLTGGVVERKQTLAILANVLLVVSDNTLEITGTDLEVEMVARTKVMNSEDGRITVPARKFSDICRALPEGAIIELALEGERILLKSGRSRFVLTTQPAAEFPNIEAIQGAIEIAIPQKTLKSLIEQTHFAMASQDVRYYLNGLMLEVSHGILRTVATDGHRLALCEQLIEENNLENQQIIIPRKGVMELIRLLSESDEEVILYISANHIRIETTEICLTSKLIDGRFPDYQRVVPQGGDNIILVERNLLQQAVTRASILSNERYRSIRLQLSNNVLRILANNPDQEEAEEELFVNYVGDPLEIGFNANYMLDALNAIKESEVKITLTDSNSCCLIESAQNAHSKYVVMPMRI